MIRSISILFLSFCFSVSMAGNASMDLPLEDKYEEVTVYFFLLDECIISQNYTPVMREIYEQYNSEQITFEGLFPNTWTSEEDMLAFDEKYNLPFPIRIAHDKELARKFNVKVCPEVVVYSESADETLYQGRIDNWYFGLGKRRRKASTSDLKDALESIVNLQPIAVKQTEAVGCVINYHK